MAKDYRLLFTLPAANVVDLKLGPDFLLMLQRTPPMTRTTTSSSNPDAGIAVYQAGQAARAGHIVVGAGVDHEAEQSPTRTVRRPRGPLMPLLVYAAANGQVGCGVCTVELGGGTAS